MASRAVLRYLRASPRKVGQVADLVRGKQVSEALHLLALTPRRPAKPLAKLIRSAVANSADRGGTDDAEALIVRQIAVEQGPTLKRYRARARGRAARIRHRTTHVTVEIEEA
ncbi:MAG: 50S ribosomal protein L22 [Nitrospinota bacterium]